jgi:hypothetical protein
MTADSPVDQFIVELIRMCPEHFKELTLVTTYGRKFLMANGCRLVISCTEDRAVSRLHAEAGVPPQDVVDAAVVLAHKYSHMLSPQRNRLIASLDELSRCATQGGATASNRQQLDPTTSTGSIDSQSSDLRSADPLSSITPTATIGVRPSGKGMSGRAGTGFGDPSGWSQEIGKRCEQFAFDCIAARFGVDSCNGAPHPSEVRLRLAAGDRFLRWLNADGEQHQSWDIEERDASTGQILRRHEVKARTAELTEAEYALAVQHGDSYMIWRVDPEAGQCDRCAVRERTPMGPATGVARRLIGRVENAIETECADGTTLVVLRRSTREYCRDLQRQFPSVVGRYRRNLVVCFPMTPELEKRLPASKARLWIANRSRGGCERCADALLQAKGALRIAHSDGLLVVALLMSTRLGTARAIQRLAQRPALCLRGISGGLP